MKIEITRSLRIDFNESEVDTLIEALRIASRSVSGNDQDVASRMLDEVIAALRIVESEEDPSCRCMTQPEQPI